MTYPVRILTPQQANLVKRVTTQVTALCEELNQLFPGRANLIQAIKLAMTSGENVIIYGPGGTAKTKIMMTVLNSIDDASAFRILISAQTMPSHLIGQQVLKKLDEGVTEFNVENTLVTCNTAMLDEYGNANSMTATALNMILHEHVFMHGVQLYPASLHFALAASNLEPGQFSQDPRVLANLDRFIFKIQVRDLTDPKDELQMLVSSLPGPSVYQTKNHVNIADLIAFRELIMNENFIGDPLLLSAYLDLVHKIENESGINYTNRSMVKILQLLEVISFFDGQTEVELEDLTKLEPAFTDGFTQTQIDLFRKTVASVVKTYEGKVGKQIDGAELALIGQLLSQIPQVTRQSKADELLQAHNKIQEIRSVMSTIRPSLQPTWDKLEQLNNEVDKQDEKIKKYIQDFKGI